MIDAHANGVANKIITDDHSLIAKNNLNALDMGEQIFNADGLPMFDMETKKKPENQSHDYGNLCFTVDGIVQVFPAHKFIIVECL